MALGARASNHPLGRASRSCPTAKGEGGMQPDLFPTMPTKAPRPYSIPAYRIALVRERALPWERAQPRPRRAAPRLFRTYLGDTDREHFLVAMLDQKNKVIGINMVSTGSLTASVVHPRELLQAA